MVQMEGLLGRAKDIFQNRRWFVVETSTGSSQEKKVNSWLRL